MTSRDFCFWLQGHLELSDGAALNATKVDLIKRHLNLVFKHEIDPAMGGHAHQVALNAIHSPAPARPDTTGGVDENGETLRC